MKPVAELPTSDAGEGALPTSSSRAEVRSAPRATPIPRSASTARAASGSPIARSSARRYSTPSRLVLAHLRPPARRRPLDRADRGSSLRRPARRSARCCCRTSPADCSSSTTPTAATPRRRAIDNQIYMSYRRSARRPGRAEAGAARARQEGPEARRSGRRRRRTRSSASATIASRPAARSISLLRGEFHRHTEISWDGGPDGSLEDMFRYAIDAAAHGLDRQRRPRQRRRPRVLLVADAEVHRRLPRPGRFTPMFTYERSVAYPHGHRNCMFAQRGVRTLPRLAEPDGEKRGRRHPRRRHQDALPLPEGARRHLRRPHQRHQHGHRLARQRSGGRADRRDLPGRPHVLREGGAPARRLRSQERTRSRPTSPAGIPKGFIDHALCKKGYRLGFQASSDHLSTHISYCIVAGREARPRGASSTRVKKRHCLRRHRQHHRRRPQRRAHHGRRVQDRRRRPPCRSRSSARRPLARVDILKDSEVVHTFEPRQARVQGRRGPTRNRPRGRTTTTSACCRSTTRSPGGRRCG